MHFYESNIFKKLYKPAQNCPRQSKQNLSWQRDVDRINKMNHIMCNYQKHTFSKGVHTVIFFWYDRPRVGGPMCSTPPSGHYNIIKKIGLYGFFVAQQ